ncbi:hypothetical protein H072_5463 [Dactylellina haptotyla CBS 200.50]|uniref:Uncharacterized protein n=1 Tax=Dactylellina haptotyla (strain CBS 200.50) TaxID=1284197 RepID=S8BZ63_DACHA|nr:hypothetical protein H072_5463 [Dactylellina haptotyla CBS 200.50]
MNPPQKDGSAYHAVRTELAGSCRLRTGDNDDFDELVRYSTIRATRTSMIACSRRYNFLFIAIGSKVKAYRPSYPSQCISDPLITLRGPEVLPHLRNRGYINRTVPHTINNMIVADLGNEEILLVANDNGYVTLWYTKHLIQRQGNMDIWFDVKQSAWGLSVHKTKRLIAISANTTIISVYEMGNEAIDPDKPPRGAESPISLEAKSQNLPCLSFLQEDARGRYLVSTDIAGNVICYDLLKGAQTSTNYNGQGWTVTFVSERDFLWVEREEFEGLIEKAKTDSIKAAAGRGLLSFALRQDDEDDADEDMQDDWASDVQMTLYGGDDSDELEDDSDDESYEDEDDDEDADMSDEYDDEIETSFTALEEAIIPQNSEDIEEAYDMQDIETEELALLGFTEEAQTAAYGPIPTSGSDSPAGNPDGPAMESLLTEEEEPPWEYPLPSFIIHSKEFDLKLLGMQDPPTTVPARSTLIGSRMEHIMSLVTLRNLIPPDPITVNAQASRFPLRMNMHAYIPALSLYVVGRQDGRAALVRLLRTKPSAKEEPSSLQPMMNGSGGRDPQGAAKEHCHFLHLEHIIPFDINIPFALAGICVAPVQGWEDRDVTGSMSEETSQRSWLYSAGDVGGRWRIFLLYTNGSVICYTVSGSVGPHENGIVF